MVFLSAGPSAPDVVSVELDASDLKAFLVSKPIVVLNCYSVGCKHCQIMGPTFEGIAADLCDRASFARIELGRNKQTAYDLDIYSTPTFIIFRNGRKEAVLEGEMPEKELRRKLMKFLEGGMK